jgi:uncharacterized protein YndB with AHSA1/START domain
MTETTTLSAYGVQTEPATVRLQRLLPGPVERVWAYLTESDLRRQWLARGDMDLKVGGKVELVWRNDELTGHAEARPGGVPAEHRMETTITRIEAPRLLAFGWNNGSEVTFELEPQGGEVLLTVTHRRLSGRDGMLGVSAGWHTHLDVLADRLAGRAPRPFWSSWSRLRAEYDERLSKSAG